MPKGPQRFNAYEEQARARKAYDFASYLDQKGVTADDLDMMHPDVLAKHVQSAGLRSHPSPETLGMVRGHLQHSAKLRAKPMSTDEVFRGLG